MKVSYFIKGLCLFMAMSLSSCGGSSSSSSTGCFGKIPGMIDSYKNKNQKIKSETNEKNFGKKLEEADALEKETAVDVEKVAISLDGKELDCSMDEVYLKKNNPVKIKFEKMNGIYPWYKFDTEVVAATDIPLKVNDTSRLKQYPIDGIDKTKVLMPVKMEYLDKDGNVVKQINSVGNFRAENDGKTAVIKAGTPIVFHETIAVSEDLLGAESIRFILDLDKEPNIVPDFGNGN